MITVDRYLHFDNIDIEKPNISSQCSHCGQMFKAEPRPGERVDDVLLRIRLGYLLLSGLAAFKVSRMEDQIYLFRAAYLRWIFGACTVCAQRAHVHLYIGL